MGITNNNEAVEKELACRYYKSNQKKNSILILSIIMSVFLIYSVFSIAKGKVRSDYLIDVRGMGTLATVALKDGSQTQYEQMRELPYLLDVGIIKTAQKECSKDNWTGKLVYVNSEAFDKILGPAYTDILGEYPQEVDEIMLPIRAFAAMNIAKPEIGMEIPIEIKSETAGTNIQVFHLSGYYTDYIDASINIPEAYISEAYMNAHNLSILPADKIIATQNDEEADIIEQRIYSDITMESDTQQVFGENPMVMQSIKKVFGSKSIALVCMMLIIVCAFMLVYNVVSITMGKDIRQYGLLKVLGTTNTQLKKISYRQNFWNIGIGVLAGSVIGGVTVKLFLQFALQKLFMRGLGKSDVRGIYPEYLMIAVLLTSITAFAATGLAIRQVMKWNAIDSIKYTNASFYDGKKKRTSNDVSMWSFAWRNITRSKKRLYISMISLLLGEIIFLGATVIVTGTDQTNEILERPDFNTGILTGIFRHPEKIPDEVNDNTPILSSKLVDKIINLDGIQSETLDYVKGSYAVIDFDKDQALSPRKKSISDETGGEKLATIQIVSPEYVSELEEYVKDKKYPIDINSLKDGTGCVLLHYDEMSQILNEQAGEVLGESIHFYPLTAYGQKENAGDSSSGELACAGYLDCTDAYFPKLHTTSMGNNINYFIMTEEAFEQLPFSVKTFDISFDAEKNEKDSVYQKLTQIIQQENALNGEMDTFYIQASYLLLETKQDEIQTAKLMLGSLASILLLIGILNFSNTLISNHTEREKELGIMQCIGLSNRQLLKMTLMEGCWYLILSVTGVVTIGSIVIWELGNAIGKKLLYFRFFYPWKQLILLTFLTLAINVVLAWLMYIREKRRPVFHEVKHFA